jgi:transcriptional regulator with XRE-family HTH domain
MMNQPASPTAHPADGGRSEGDTGGTPPVHQQIGSRLREARQRAGIGVRELARQLELSASLISQIELGRVVPSVSTLYAITTTLGISIDGLFGEQDTNVASAHGAEGSAARLPPAALTHESPFIQRRASRRSIDLEQGVRWELLTPQPEPGAEFLEVTYPVGGSSSPTQHAMSHNGRDYCLIREGVLSVQIGFEAFELTDGDSCSFDATIPHRFWNAGTQPVRAVWFVLDRWPPPSSGRVARVRS